MLGGKQGGCMASEMEILLRAYRGLWQQEIRAIDQGKLAIQRNGLDATAHAREEYSIREQEISVMLTRLSDA
jgi:hypothetical protein